MLTQKENKMSVLTKTYNTQAEHLYKELEKINKTGLFPFTDKRTGTPYTFQTQQDTLKSLFENKFTISVCGVVKAGKSTFLNALLFGEKILPAFYTPMTAKLTFLEYTDKPQNYFKATFYTPEEFKELKQYLEQNDPKALEQLEKRLQTVAEKYGEYAQNWIGQTPVEVMDLSQLGSFVSDPAAEDKQDNNAGQYTPFVKDVTIYIHHPDIKNIRIVDTPGLRDTNIINSKETQKWIGKTHALIYLFPAKGASESDLDFLLKEIKTSVSNRLFVINRIDSYNNMADLEKVKQRFRQYGLEPRFKEEGLFGPEETFCGYSSLFVLTEQMIAKNSETDAFIRKRMELQKSQGFIWNPDHLEEKLEAKLYHPRDKERLARCKESISNIYTILINNREIEKINLEETIKDLNSSDEDLKKQLKEAQTFNKEWIEKNEEIEKNLITRISTICSNFEEDILKVFEAFQDQHMKQYCSIRDLRRSIALLRHPLERLEFNVRQVIKKFKYKIEELSVFQKNELDKFCTNHNLETNIVEKFLSTISFDIKIPIENICQELMDKVPANFFTQFFHNSKNVEADTLAKLSKQLTRVCECIKNTLLDEKAQEGYQMNLKISRDKLGEEINKRFEKKDKSLKTSQAEKLQKKAACNARISELNQEISKIKDMEKEFKWAEIGEKL